MRASSGNRGRARRDALTFIARGPLLRATGEEPRMLTARCKAEVLKKVLDATNPLVDEAKFKITPDGISLKAVDPAHVAMIDLQLRKAAFLEYKADDME